MVAEQNVERIFLGATFALLSFFCLALMGAFAKMASHYTTASVLVFFQNAISFVCILPIVFLSKTFTLKTSRLSMHIFRAVMGTGAWYGLFFSIAKIPLTTAILLTYSAPLWMAFFAWFLFGEKITFQVWLGIVIGFIGIMLVLNPIGSRFNIAMFFALAAAILLAFALFAVRWLGKTESILSILFYYFLISSLLVLPLALLHWQTPLPVAWIYIFAIGLSLIISQAFIILAYRFASPVSLGPYIYSVIIFSVLIDCVIWGHQLSQLEWLGIIFVIAGGFLSALKKKPITV